MRACIVGDGIDVLEREFLVAQGGEELALGIARLGLDEFAQRAVVALQHGIDGQRQPARALVGIDLVQQEGAHLVGRIGFAVLDDRRLQPLGQARVEAGLDAGEFGVAGRILGAIAQDLAHFARHQGG